jgi:hypothetical protein
MFCIVALKILILLDSSFLLFRTFHVFKIFVANPEKPAEIESVLINNKVKLIAYLENFQTSNEDPQFVDEKRLLIECVHYYNCCYFSCVLSSSYLFYRFFLRFILIKPFLFLLFFLFLFVFSLHWYCGCGYILVPCS